jgi:hypothetical protein
MGTGRLGFSRYATTRSSPIRACRRDSERLPVRRDGGGGARIPLAARELAGQDRQIVDVDDDQVGNVAGRPRPRR